MPDVAATSTGGTCQTMGDLNEVSTAAQAMRRWKEGKRGTVGWGGGVASAHWRSHVRRRHTLAAGTWALRLQNLTARVVQTH